MNLTKTILLALFLLPNLVNANKVDKVQASPESPDINTEFAINLTFIDPDDKVSCGIGIDWGDGEKQKLRIGIGHQVPPPFKLTHTYTTPGEKKISIKGEFIARGLNSTGGCDINKSGSFTIQDPAVRAEKERVEKERLAELERQAQLAAQKKRDREDYLASSAGRKELENSIKTFEKLFEKPLAINCSLNNLNALLFKKADKESNPKQLNFSGDKPPAELIISKFYFPEKDVISITSLDNVTIEYKFTDKTLQVFNSKLVTNGNYNSNPTPILNACESKTPVAKLALEELSGIAEKRRQATQLQAEAEAKAREEARPYTLIYMCFDSNGYGLDKGAAQAMISEYSKIQGGIDIRQSATIINLYGFDKKNGSGAICQPSNGSLPPSRFSSLYSPSVVIGESGDKIFYWSKNSATQSTVLYRMKN